jgi:hypothetical protein
MPLHGIITGLGATGFFADGCCAATLRPAKSEHIINNFLYTVRFIISVNNRGEKA